VVSWRFDGVDEKTARKPFVPSRKSLLGILEHLARVERCWFQRVIAGREVRLARLDGDKVSARRILIHMIGRRSGTPTTPTSSGNRSTAPRGPSRTTARSPSRWNDGPRAVGPIRCNGT
jgi:hypothetical protein